MNESILTPNSDDSGTLFETTVDHLLNYRWTRSEAIIRFSLYGFVFVSITLLLFSVFSVLLCFSGEIHDKLKSFSFLRLVRLTFNKKKYYVSCGSEFIFTQLCLSTFEHRNDRNFVLESVRQNGLSFQYVGRSLTKDREIVLEAVKQNGKALKIVDERMQCEREIVLEAVKSCGKALRYTSEELKNDRNLVLEAVKQNGKALEYASCELQNDEEVVLEAVKQNSVSLFYASDELRNGKEFLLKMIVENNVNVEVLFFSSDEIKKDKEVVLKAVVHSSEAMKFCDDELKNDEAFVLQIFREIFQKNQKKKKKKKKLKSSTSSTPSSSRKKIKKELDCEYIIFLLALEKYKNRSLSPHEKILRKLAEQAKKEKVVGGIEECKELEEKLSRIAFEGKECLVQTHWKDLVKLKELRKDLGIKGEDRIFQRWFVEKKGVHSNNNNNNNNSMVMDQKKFSMGCCFACARKRNVWEETVESAVSPSMFRCGFGSLAHFRMRIISETSKEQNQQPDQKEEEEELELEEGGEEVCFQNMVSPRILSCVNEGICTAQYRTATQHPIYPKIPYIQKGVLCKIPNIVRGKKKKKKRGMVCEPCSKNCVVEYNNNEEVSESFRIETIETGYSRFVCACGGGGDESSVLNSEKCGCVHKEVKNYDFETKDEVIIHQYGWKEMLDEDEKAQIYEKLADEFTTLRYKYIEKHEKSKARVNVLNTISFKKKIRRLVDSQYEKHVYLKTLEYAKKELGRIDRELLINSPKQHQGILRMKESLHKLVEVTTKYLESTFFSNYEEGWDLCKYFLRLKLYGENSPPLPNTRLEKLGSPHETAFEMLVSSARKVKDVIGMFYSRFKKEKFVTAEEKYEKLEEDLKKHSDLLELRRIKNKYRRSRIHKHKNITKKKSEEDVLKEKYPLEHGYLNHHHHQMLYGKNLKIVDEISVEKFIGFEVEILDAFLDSKKGGGFSVLKKKWREEDERMLVMKQRVGQRWEQCRSLVDEKRREKLEEWNGYALALGEFMDNVLLKEEITEIRLIPRLMEAFEESGVRSSVLSVLKRMVKEHVSMEIEKRIGRAAEVEEIVRQMKKFFAEGSLVLNKLLRKRMMELMFGGGVNDLKKYFGRIEEFSKAKKSVRSNRVIAFDAVKQDGSLLEYVSEELKDDERLVLEAVKQNGEFIKYASQELKNNKEVVMKAVRLNVICSPSTS